MSVSPPFHRALPVALALAALGLTGCSLRHYATSRLGDALAESGAGTFASDDDPELIKAAAPFSLKLMEALLNDDPANDKLLLAASSGFTEYDYAFVEPDADALEPTDFAGAQAIRGRARRLYLRARDYGLRGLEVRHPGFRAALAAHPAGAVANTVPADVPLLYWTAAAWGAAISVGKDTPSLLAEIPQMEALIDRALALDESWGDGAIHDFLITYEMSRQGVTGDPAERSRQHFERALALAGGKQAGPYVLFAEAVCIEKQDAAQFAQLLNRALAVNPEASPEYRLANVLMQRRARWLLSKKDDLFLNPAKPAAPERVIGSP